MAKKTKDSNLSIEERLEQALIPNWDEPYKLPDNWCWINLKSVLQHQSGNSKLIKGKLESEKKDGLYDAYSASGQDVYTASYEHEGDAIIVSAVGARCGKAFLAKGKWSAIANTHIIYTNDKLIDIRYLYYILNDEFWWVKRGNAQPFIVVNESLSKPFALPPLNEQHRIVAQVESLFAKLDEAKEKAQEIVDGFETRKSAILNKAFSGELTTSWRKWHSPKENTTIKAVKEYSLAWTKKEQRLLNDEQQKATILTMRDGHNWVKCTIGAVARVNNGSTPSRQKTEYWNGDIPWVSSGEVRNNYINDTLERITKDGFENSSVKLLPIDTVLIAMVGEGKTRGQSAVLKIPATTNQNIAAIIMDHGMIVGEYMWYWLQMNYSKNREKGSGSGQQALNCQRVRELEFIFPRYEEQKEIVRILDALISKEQQVKEVAETVIEQINTMKKAILARAFRGELGTNDPSEESALELLKQII